MHIGIIGTGSIGKTIAGAADGMDEISTIYLLDNDTDRAYTLKSIIYKAVVAEDYQQLLDNCSTYVEIQEAIIERGGR